MTINHLGICRNLGIFGWEAIEEMLLSCLITGESCLLIGGAGSTKTHGVRQLSRLVTPFGEDPTESAKYFQAYDAPTISFDDLCGIPDFHRLKDGKMAFMPSDMSIWHKTCVLIDELNRANPDMQGKLLQLILSRRVMGAATGVTYTFAAMNPLTYIGTQELDKALADRFSYLLKVPDGFDLSEDDRLLAIQANGSDSMLAIQKYNPALYKAIVEAENIVDPAKSPKVSEASVLKAIEDFRALRHEILGPGTLSFEQSQGALLTEIASTYRLPIAQYLNQIIELNKASILGGSPVADTDEKKEALNTLPSVRRMGMIRKNIEARLAIRIASSSAKISPEEVLYIAKETFLNGMTNSAMRSNQYDVALYEKAHPIASEVLKSIGNPWNYRVVTERSPIKALSMTLAFLRDEPSLVETQVDRCMSVPQSNGQAADNDLVESLSLNLDSPTAYRNTNVIPRIISPILVALYSAPLIDVDSRVLSETVTNKIASRVKKALQYVKGRNIENDLLLLDSDIVGATYSKCDKVFESLAKFDANYKVSRLLFASAATAVSNVRSKGTELLASQALECLFNDIMVVHENLEKYLAPVYRSLFFESCLPTGLTEAQHLEEIKAFTRRVKGLPEVVVTQATTPEVVAVPLDEEILIAEEEDSDVLVELSRLADSVDIDIEEPTEEVPIVSMK